MKKQESMEVVEVVETTEVTEEVKVSKVKEIGSKVVEFGKKHWKKGVALLLLTGTGLLAYNKFGKNNNDEELDYEDDVEYDDEELRELAEELGSEAE